MGLGLGISIGNVGSSSSVAPETSGITDEAGFVIVDESGNVIVDEDG